MRLVDLRVEFRSVMSLIEETCDDGGVVDPVLAGRLREISCDIREKLGNYAGMLLTLKAQGEVLEAEINRLRRRIESIEGTQKWLKALALDTMREHGFEKLEVGVRRLRIQKNSVASLIIDDESAIPAELLIQPAPVPDKECIRTMLTEGHPVPGARLELGSHLRVQ